MSIRIAMNRIWNHGRFIVRSFTKKLPTQELSGPPPRDKILPLRGTNVRASLGPSGAAGSGAPRVQSHFETARRLFVDNVLRRVTNSMSSDLRKRTTRQLLFGNATPFFALVGVSLASGTGIITKDDEMEGIVWEIRDAVARMQRSLMDAESDLFEPNEEISLNKFAIGPLISKGSNGVVYAARKVPPQTEENDYDSGRSVVLKTEGRQREPLLKFPFALKMMFNYHAESNSLTIFRAMHRETVPARSHYTSQQVETWQQTMLERTVCLRPHPNIVSMHCVFTDSVPMLPESFDLYPQALPMRLNPEGDGRNMSLFLLMKRYDLSLKEHLTEGLLRTRDAVLLFTQLLEAVSHMNKNGVAHRDLKSDNILLEIADDDSCPGLVVTDFGCCLADKTLGLVMPYRTYDTDKGGNPALMAPEVALAEPGMFTSINYSKSDAWAVGAIAYELFCGYNPFYRSSCNSNPLKSTDYEEFDLPPLPDKVPETIRHVVAALLARNPSRRLSAEFAATVCQLHLWAPSVWLKPTGNEPLPPSSEILQWLLCLSTKVLCTRGDDVGKRRSTVEYQLIASFLSRAKLSSIKSALVWLRRG